MNPPVDPVVNSEGVFSWATTCSPSTTTRGMLPPIKLSSSFDGTYIELNISHETNPASLHSLDGISPEVAQNLLETIPSGCSNRCFGAINSGNSSVSSLTI